MSAGVKVGSVARLLEAAAAAPSPRDRLWSRRPGALARYVLTRSRGFVHRSASRFSSDLIEVFAMSQIAVPALALTVGATAALNGLLNAMTEGVLRAYRGAAREGRPFSRRALLAYSLAVVAIPYAAVFLTVALTADGLFLVALRAITAAVDAGVSALTARATLARRPWLPPWVTWTPLGAATVAALASVEAGGQAGVLGLAWSMAAARIFVQLAFLRSALRGRRDARPAPGAPPRPVDTLRILGAMSPFLPGIVVSGALGQRDTPPGGSVLAALLVMPIVFKLVARPFQASELDLRLAVARFGAAAGQQLLPRVARLCAAVAVGSLALTAGLAFLLGGSSELLWLLAWVTALATGRAVLSVGSTCDRDLRWAVPALLVHGAQCLLVPAATPLAVAVEVLFVAACLRGLRPSALAHAHPRRAVVREVLHTPARFSASLESAPGACLKLGLATARRGHRAMQTLLDALAGVAPEGTRLLAVDPMTVLVGWEDGAFPLRMAAPLDIAQVTPMTAEEAQAFLGAPSAPRSVSPARRWTLTATDGCWRSQEGAVAEGRRIPWLLEARREGDRSLFWRGTPRVQDPVTREVYVAHRRAGRTVEVETL